MDNILLKLRKSNKNKYRQLTFCLTIAITLVSSFAALLLSNMIKVALPSGGDSQMQAGLLFVIDLIGCFLLIWYALNLFINNISRELGILLTMGISRKELRKFLLYDIVGMLAKSSIIGIVCGNILTYIIWNIFRTTFGKEQYVPYQFSFPGIILSLFFCMLIMLFMQFSITRYVKKAHVLELLYVQNKNEIVVEVTRKKLFLGIFCTFLGVFLGYGVSIISSFVFHKGVPGIWKVTYLFSVYGIYQILVYCVSSHKKGKNPSHYYKNIIAYSLMKFQGIQNVKSMCVISLLLFGGLFAIYYPLDLVTVAFNVKNESPDFSIPFISKDHVLDKREISDLANEYEVEITKYKECQFANLLTGMVERDLNTEKELISRVVDKDKYCDFISVDEYNRVFGARLELNAGEYYSIVMPDSGENYFQKPNDLKYVYDIHGNKLSVTYKGNVENGEVLGADMGNKKYIINDQDYVNMTNMITESDMTSTIIFNTGESGRVDEFAEEIYEIILNRTSPEAAVNCYYDKYQKGQSDLVGEVYLNDEILEMKSNNVDLINDWKYYPLISEIYTKTMYQNAAVLLFLFSYISIICLVAVMIILYTRGLTLGKNNRRVYVNLHKLGATREYIKHCVRGQLKGMFMWSTLMGCLISAFLKISFLYGNDAFLSKIELYTVLFIVCVTCVVFVLMYGVYLITEKHVLNDINGGISNEENEQ